MTAVLSAADADKLAKILGMLGSDHAGERDVAGRKACDLVQSLGLTWPDVIRPGPPPRWLPVRSPHALAAQCAKFPAVLTTWECQFLAEIAALPRPPSAKQLSILQKIAVRARIFAETIGTAS